MNKSIRVFTLTALSLFITIGFCSLSAQISDSELMQEIYKELIIETEMLNSHLEEARIIADRIKELKDGYNPQERVAQLIAANDTAGLLREFQKFASRLETYLLRDPDQASSYFSLVKRLFADVTVVQDQILYFDGAVHYYKNNDLLAVDKFEKFFVQYPNSTVSTKAMALTLKALIGLNQDARADRDFLQAYPHITSNEIRYLSAHVYFNLGRDDQALAMFDSLSNDEKYGIDSNLMSNLIVSFTLDPSESISQFQIIDNVLTNNPFVVLALARYYILQGNWQRAEAQYSRYYSLHVESRKQLSQYELVLSLLNSGKKQEASQLLEEMMASGQSGEFYTTFLYLWADIKMSEGKLSEVRTRFSQFQGTIDQNRIDLPRRIGILRKIEGLKNDLYRNPETQDFIRISREMIGIANEVTELHNQIVRNIGSLPRASLDTLHKYELQIISQYLALFENYSSTYMLRYMPDMQSIKMLEAYETYIEDYQRVVNLIKTRINELEQMDLKLQRQNDVDRNIEVITRIFQTIEQIRQAKPDFAVDPDIIAKYEADLAEYMELRDFYQYDNTLYLAINDEIADFQDFKAVFDAFTVYAKNIFRTAKPIMEVERQLREIREETDQFAIVPQEYVEVIDALISRFDRTLFELDLIHMHLDYASLIRQDEARASMSFEQSRSEQTRIIAEMQTLSTRILQFVNTNPDFVALVQPMNFGHLFSKANLYYYLAELDYAINLRDIKPTALEYYRKVLDADPAFYMKDAVLYNIGFYSSYLLKGQIEEQKDQFWRDNPTALTRPDNLMETEAYYRESLAAYTELINAHSNSPYYDETMYRLGSLYFDIGSDASEPVKFYAIAREKYFNPLIEDENSRYRYEAMYQRGWTYLNSNDEESLFNALGDFMTLLTAIEDGKITDPVLVADYTDASVSNIAYALIAVDGSDYDQPAKGAAYVETRMKDFINYKLIQSIIDEAIKMKNDLSAPMHVTDFMFTRMNLEPLSVQNPIRLKEILQIYYQNQRLLRDNADIRNVQLATYEKVKSMFNHESEWFNANKDKEISEQLAFIKEAYDFLEVRLNNNFVENPNVEAFEAYQKHIDDYIAFAQLQAGAYEAWKQGRMLNLTILSRMMAETSNDPALHFNAVNRLHAFNAMYPDNSDYFVNEALSYQLIEHVFDNLADPLFAMAAAFPEKNLPADQDSLFATYKAAVERYSSVLISERHKTQQNIETYIALKLRVADIEMSNGDYPAASKTLQSTFVVEEELPGVNKRDLYIRLAELADVNADRAASETWYRKAQEYALNAQDRDNFIYLAQEQIAKGIEEAASANNFSKVGNDYLRLSEEYKASDAAKSRAFKISAASAFKDAQDYQRSIDLIIEVAGDLQSVDDVFGLYAEAWIIADSLKQDTTQARALKDQFMSAYPASLQTYALRVERLKVMEKDPAQKQRASELYLVLHDDVKSGKINSGTDTAQDLFLNAIVLSSENEDKMYTLMDQFSEIYPGHSKALDFLEAIALNADSRGDKERFKQLAKEIYTKDKSRSQNYQLVAERELKAVLDEFNTHYAKKEWQQAFAKRDEFKRIEAAYIREGLKFMTAEIYEEFARIEKEHKEIQDRIAFIKNYDSQLASFERGFLAAKYSDMIRVNPNTTWMRHLAGGENRVTKLKTQADAEAAKVYRLLDSAKGKGLDLDRQSKTYNLVARIYEHGAEAVRTQIEYYLSRSNEIQNERSTPDFANTLDILRNQKEIYANSFLAEAYLAHLDVYDLIYMAGYKNRQTDYSISKFNEWNALPDQMVDDLLPDGSWEIKVVNIETNQTVATGQINRVTTPQGTHLSSVSVPSKHVLKLKKIVRSRVVPDYGYAQMIYPYDAIIKVNGKQLNPAYQSVDTLDVTDPLTTRYAVLLSPDVFIAGENALEFEFSNNSDSALNTGFALRLVTNRQRYEQAIPLETMTIASGSKWKASKIDAENTMTSVPTLIVEGYQIENSAIMDMEYSDAKAIWVHETADAPVHEVTFETEFVIDTEFRSGYVVCAAPGYVTLVINGVEVETEFMFDYDPDPMTVYPLRYDFRSEDIVKGKNTVKFIVKNDSEFRGFQSEIQVVKTGKEGGI